VRGEGVVEPPAPLRLNGGLLPYFGYDDAAGRDLSRHVLLTLALFFTFFRLPMACRFLTTDTPLKHRVTDGPWAAL
jgi:hypothetical protein